MGATYQRLVNKLSNMIGRNMEVYIDDMLVKSPDKDSHIQDLQECFDVIKQLGMKLNPSKCTFGVQGGKFFGIPDLPKRHRNQPGENKGNTRHMNPPTTKKEVQKLTGKMAALSRFLSRAAERVKTLIRRLKERGFLLRTKDCAEGVSNNLNKASLYYFSPRNYKAGKTTSAMLLLMRAL
ncbi:UNVERIFIED_CONTAM: hypothetical protein Sradi_3583000 [Sesamum radiatum]|uniref:Reverse transcriptase domain-containing protein n=1 Tax=Sesamum radiatum TaxID=300843 RepID=A0AAW2QGB0_SESRA